MFTGLANGKDNNPQVQSKKTDLFSLAMSCITVLSNPETLERPVHWRNGAGPGLIKISLRYDVVLHKCLLFILLKNVND